MTLFGFKGKETQPVTLKCLPADDLREYVQGREDCKRDTITPTQTRNGRPEFQTQQHIRISKFCISMLKIGRCERGKCMSTG